MGEHWYSRSGEPRYESIGANGLRRSTTLADARKSGYVPSVTTVLGVIDKAALTNWKVDQAILAALTLPRVDGEPEASLLSRIKADSGAQARAAAEEGNRIHDAIECHFRGLAYPDRYKPHVDGVRRELWKLFPEVTDWVAERSFGHIAGFGGKVDLHSPSTGIVVDHKGKDFCLADGEPKRFAYDQHWQLAAYQNGLQLPRNVCANMFVSRTSPGDVVGHKWTVNKIDEGWRVFCAALELWKAMRNYDPSFELEIAA